MSKFRPIKYRLLKIFILLSILSLRCEATVNQGPPMMGNFALPTSQQPGPLVGMGQNVIDKNETQIFLTADDFTGRKKHSIDVVPSILYGITDYFSLFINMPIAASYKNNNNYSAGLEDAFLQFEYAFFYDATSQYTNQATVLANVTYPTGSYQKKPPTGAGSPTFLLGATFNRTYVDWFMFASSGAILTTTIDQTKMGNSYLYQFGIGKNILSKNDWIFAWLIESDGTYTEQSRMKGARDFNSGGNIVYITPSIWLSSKTFLLQFGGGLPITQNLYGNQTRFNYLLMGNVGWSIY